MRVPALLLLTLVIGVASPTLAGGQDPAVPEDPVGIPPPPPLLLDPEDPDALEPLPPPPAAEPPAPVPPPPDAPAAPILVENDGLPLLWRGVLAGAAGAGVGAALGGAALVYGGLVPGAPELLLLVLSPAVPAMAAFFAGAAVIMFVLENPTADDWGTVAACTAAGCLALGLIAVGAGGGGLSILNPGCSGCSGCNGCYDPCGLPGTPAMSTSPRSSDDLIWASAGAGIGGVVGIFAGGAAGLGIGASTSGSVSPFFVTLVSAMAGSALGATVGGAIGGGLAGSGEEETRAQRRALAGPKVRQSGSAPLR